MVLDVRAVVDAAVAVAGMDASSNIHTHKSYVDRPMCTSDMDF